MATAMATDARRAVALAPSKPARTSVMSWGKARPSWSAMANSVRRGGGRFGASGGNSGRRLRGLLGEALQSCAHVSRQHGGEQRGRDGDFERHRVLEASYFIESYGPLPVSEKQLYFPSYPVQFGDVMRGEHLARQGRQVISLSPPKGTQTTRASTLRRSSVSTTSRSKTRW